MTRRRRVSFRDQGIQLANDEWAPTLTGGPRAQREQATSGEWDTLMVNLAREKHPTIAWWWGYRHPATGGHFAVCYICEEEMTTVRPAGGLTDAQRRAILDHRAGHYTDMLGKDT